MIKKLFPVKSCSGECRKMQKRIEKILKDFNKNEILKSGLLHNQAFVIRKFLFYEIGCLKGIAKKLSEENSK